MILNKCEKFGILCRKLKDFYINIYFSLRNYTSPKEKMKIKFFFSNFGQVKKMKFNEHFLLIKRILINIFLIFPYL